MISPFALSALPCVADFCQITEFLTLDISHSREVVKLVRYTRLNSHFVSQKYIYLILFFTALFILLWKRDLDFFASRGGAPERHRVP